jgi:hypothetical protein
VKVNVKGILTGSANPENDRMRGGEGAFALLLSVILRSVSDARIPSTYTIPSLLLFCPFPYTIVQWRDIYSEL